MGSVKDLDIIEKPAVDKSGVGRFVFSDRYSVFDWGEMPQHIENKGKSLCIIGAYFSEKLHSMGIKTHYRGVVENGTVKKLDELIAPSNIMEVNLLRVLEPDSTAGVYDYSVYNNEKSNFLIPLEVIYRNWLPAGASVFKRLEDGSAKLDDLGLSKMPEPGQKLEKPIFDVSTKLESTDRYVTWEEAMEMAHLTAGELNDIKQAVETINELISKETAKMGLINNDGKMELGFDESRDIVVVDVLGTPDECRFTCDDMPVSKEIARIFYRDTAWYKDVNDAKKKDRLKWKDHVQTEPPLLPERLAELIGVLYQGFCNELTGRAWFDVPSLKEALLETNSILKEKI